MSGLISAIKLRLGLSVTPAENFVIRNPADGTLRVSRGNPGSEIADVLTVLSGNQLQAAAHPATGNRSLQLATMQKFADEFGALLAVNGYQRLPSGLVIQWLTTAPSSSSGPVAFTFPFAFSAPPLWYGITLGTASGGLFPGVDTISANGGGFSAFSTTSARVANQACRIVAIGT